MITKHVKITITNLRQANDINYCYYLQDCIIDTLLSTEDVRNIYFERDKTIIVVAFDVKIGAVADYITTLCKEYIIELLEANDRLTVQVQDKEEISDHILVYTIQAQTAV